MRAKAKGTRVRALFAVSVTVHIRSRRRRSKKSSIQLRYVDSPFLQHKQREASQLVLARLSPSQPFSSLRRLGSSRCRSSSSRSVRNLRTIRFGVAVDPVAHASDHSSLSASPLPPLRPFRAEPYSDLQGEKRSYVVAPLPLHHLVRSSSSSDGGVGTRSDLNLRLKKRDGSGVNEVGGGEEEEDEGGEQVQEHCWLLWG